MKRLLLLSLLLLAGCEEKTDLPPSEAKTAAAPVVDTWPGKYEGDVMVRIAPDHKVILIEGQADGCTGDVGLADGGLTTNKVSDNELQLIMHPQDSPDACTFSIKRNGDTLTVSETPSCAAYHGGTCSFNGTATRVK